MNTKELLEKIARYKSAMEAETDADTKKKFQSRIDQLEKDIAQVESAVEKQEEKLEKQEDKALEEAEKKLQRYKDAMDAESDPDTKAKFKKRIDDLEKQLKGVKEQIKEEKKEIEEQKKDIKDAVQDVQSAQKTVRTQAIKKAGQQVVARKATTTKKKTRKKAIANIITKLDKLIDKNPALKAKYKGARGGSYMQYSSVDLKRDAGRASKPFGYRFKGDNTKVPRPDQRGQSNVYYENRANRADVYPKRKIKLEDGGEMMADGGMAGHGRRMATGGVVLNLYTTGADWKMNMAKQKDFDDYKSARKAGDKSGAFEYEIVDEITGDVIYSTHSEKMTPSLAYKDGGMVEYVLYGTKVGKKDWQEEVLAVRPYKFEITPELEKVTKKDGYNRLRIAKIDLSTPPDFRKIVKKSIGGEMEGGEYAKGGKTDNHKYFIYKAHIYFLNKLKQENISDWELEFLVRNLFTDIQKQPLYKERYSDMTEITKSDRDLIVESAIKSGIVEMKDGELEFEIEKDTYNDDDYYAKGGKTEDDWEVLQVRPRKKKAKTQGYDDRKDESLGMSRGKTASKDLDGTKKEKEKSRRDDAGFETRKKRGRKKHIYSWKPEAKGKVPISALKKTPSEYYAKKFPNLVNLEKQ